MPDHPFVVQTQFGDPSQMDSILKLNKSKYKTSFATPESEEQPTRQYKHALIFLGVLAAITVLLIINSRKSNKY